MAFADFEDDYATPSEIIAFLVTTFFGPLLMLNLLIAIMSDAHEECQENWEVQEIRTIYTWAQEICGMIWSVTLITRPFLGSKLLFWFVHETGYVQYCIAYPTEDPGNEGDEWLGQCNKIQNRISCTEKRILSAVETLKPNSEILIPQQKQSQGGKQKRIEGVDSHQVEYATLEMTRRIEEIEEKNAK